MINIDLDTRIIEDEEHSTLNEVLAARPGCFASQYRYLVKLCKTGMNYLVAWDCGETQWKVLEEEQAGYPIVAPEQEDPKQPDPVEIKPEDVGDSK